jgi:pimeloyl-ACP methyl ester carboxylesterase
MSHRSTTSGRRVGGARITALAVIAVLAVGLAYLRFAPGESTEVPDEAGAGELTPFTSCEYGGQPAECATIVVPENRADPESRLIALPVTRVPAANPDSSEPIFFLQGGPGVPNEFDDATDATRFTGSRDVVMVGYRGVQGSSVLACPEVSAAVKASTDLVGDESAQRQAEGYVSCAQRLAEEGVDLDGYTLMQRVEDMEAVRVALAYDRINLLSESAGTRTAMIYAWRHPESVHRSVMIAVNPPGNYLWYPETTDDQLRYYAQLCAQDEACSRRTDDLEATMRGVSTDMPDRWLSLAIDEKSVKVGSFYGLMETTSEAGLLSGPTVLDSWLSAAEGDASGLWLLNAAFIIFPDKAWGEQAATGIIDAPYAEEYYGSGGDPGSILGNLATDLIWVGGRLVDAWPAAPDNVPYQQVQPSDVETLLVGGPLDFTTPPVNATYQLLPYLSNGQQVVLDDFGHTIDFWTYQPEAADRLIDHFYDTGEVDESAYVHQAVDFTPQTTHSSVAKVLVGAMAGLVLLMLGGLLWMPLHVRRRGGFRPLAGTLLRAIVVPLVMGLGGWFLAWLVVMTFWPSVPVTSPLVMTISMGLPIAVGTYWAWVEGDAPSSLRMSGLGLGLLGGLVGAWIGLHATTGMVVPLTAIIGAAITANLALVLRSIVWDRTDRTDSEQPTAGASLAHEPEAGLPV